MDWFPPPKVQSAFTALIRPWGQSHDNNKRPSFNEEPNLTCLHYENSSNQTAESRLSYYRSNTTKLLEFLKRSDQDSIDRFIAVVRSGASHDDVFATIEQLPSSAGKYSSTHNGVSR